jgi:hypothetical protein
VGASYILHTLDAQVALIMELAECNLSERLQTTRAARHHQMGHGGVKSRMDLVELLKVLVAHRAKNKVCITAILMAALRAVGYTPCHLDSTAPPVVSLSLNVYRS